MQTTTSRIQLSQIMSQDRKYACDSKLNIKFTFNSSGCRNLVQNMPKAIYRTAIYVGLLALEEQQPYTIMITASHNPSSDNGIKIGKLNGSFISKKVLNLIESGLNDDKEFQKFISKAKNSQKYTKKIYLGRDCRQSSYEFICIAKQALQVININSFLDIGECSTPQLQSFSKYLQFKISDTDNTQKQIKYNRQAYVSGVMSAFMNAWKIVSPKPSEQSEDKKKVLLDFSNGSGIASYRSYESKLSQLFNITLINDQDFKRPNHQCGSAYMQKNWHLTLSEKYKGFDYCVFFDGDSDRVILKLKNKDKCFDGNYFTALYIKTLEKIFRLMPKQLYQKLCKYFDQKVQLSIIVNDQINFGLKDHLRKKKLLVQLCEIGIHNMFEKASNKMICVFFQPNGHGGIYMNQMFQDFCTNYKNQNQGILLLYCLSLILQNNSRGYALHNFLVFTLCSRYLYKDSLEDQLINLFTQYPQITDNISLKPDVISLFENNKNGKQKLISPTNIINKISILQNQYEDYQIYVRKSNTEANIVRINIQGETKQICDKIISQIKEYFQRYGYI